MLNTYIVTIKFPEGWNGKHDPQNKVTGYCLNDQNCTDATGEHHSFLRSAPDASSLAAALESDGYHVTRIEGPVSWA